MLKTRALEILTGVSQDEHRQASAPTNLHVISGEVGETSENGKALVRIDGLVFSGENSQYVEMDTFGGLEEGDTVTVLLTGEQGHAMTPLAIGGVGTVDRVVTRISNIEADYVKTNVLEANYAQIDAANIDTATIREAWIDNILVQSGLIAHEGTIFELDAIQINASKIKTGTIDVERLVVTGQDGHKYLVHVENETASYEKLDGDIIEDLTITADKIVAGSITAQKITTENLVGTGGWINLRSGTFQYGNPLTGAGISWDGTHLVIGGYLTSDDAEDTYATKTALSAEELKRKALYGTSSTAASTVTKVVTCDNFELYSGAVISVKFSTANTAAAPQLNVNSTGVKAIYYANAVASSTNPVLWGANATLTFLYDGTNWVLVDTKASYAGTSSTAATTRAKASTITGALIVNGTYVTIKFSTANTYTADSVQLNISSTGATAIYRDGVSTSSTNNLLWDANTSLTFVRNGAAWYLADNSSRKMAEKAAKTATSFLTDISSGGLFVHRSSDTDVSTGNGVKITEDVDIIRSGTSRLHVDSDSVDINDASGTAIVSLTGSTEEPSAGNDNRTTRSSALTMGDTTLGKASFEASLVGKNASSGSYEYKLTSASLKAQRDVGEPVDAIAIVAAEVSKQYNTSKSAYEVISDVFFRGDYLSATTRTSNQLYRIDMASFEKLLGCRIDIAWTSINVGANSGGVVTLTWANGGFKDSNYVVSPSRMTSPNGYTKVQFAITSRTATTVTLGYWNDGSTAINGMNVGVIGVDSRYASLII